MQVIFRLDLFFRGGEMARIFERTSLAGLDLENRLVRSATWEGLADEQGRVTEALLEVYQKLAQGGIGLIISSYLYVDPGGRQNSGQVGVYSDDLVPGLTRLAHTVHQGGGKLVGQIVHCGGQSRRDQIGGRELVAPSAVDSPGYAGVPRALTIAEVEQVVADFAAAARRLQQAGFDGVQLHGAHGYLLAQFLSPSRNRRTDRFGGDLAGRARFALEVFNAVRDAVGPSFPVMIKLNAHDFLQGSTTEEDSSYLAAALARKGLDALEVSGGTPGSGALAAARTGIHTAEDEAYFLPQARTIRSAAPEVPLMLVGGVRSLERMNTILQANEADYFSLCRPLIREPGLPRRWRSGDGAPAACISCSKCYGPARKGEGLICVEENRR